MKVGQRIYIYGHGFAEVKESPIGGNAWLDVSYDDGDFGLFYRDNLPYIKPVHSGTTAELIEMNKQSQPLPT